MAINFPTSPTTNDIWTENDRSWKFNGTSWDGLPIPSGSGIITYTPAGTGAVDTVVETKLRESVSVKDFGAVGDGVADDTAAIQAALDANLVVFFPAGKYRIDTQIKLRAKCQIYGEGTNNVDTSAFDGGTKLMFTGSGTSCVTQQDTGSMLNHFSIREISITATGTSSYDWIFDFYSPLGGHIDNVRAKNLYTSGGVWRSQTIIGTSSWVNHFKGIGFSVPDNSTQYVMDSTMTDSFFTSFYSTGGKGMIDRSTGGNLYASCHFDRTNANGAGITLEKQGTSDKQVVLSCCYFDVNSGYGILLDNDTATAEDWFKPVINGCVFRNTGSGAVADIYAKSTTHVAKGGIISACSFSDIAEPVKIDANWNNISVVSSLFPSDPLESNLDYHNRENPFINTNGIRVNGVIATSGGKTVYGQVNTAGFFQSGGDATAGLALGSITANTPFVGASRNSSGTATPLAFTTDGSVRIKLEADGTSFSPSVGNVTSLGKNGFRWSEVYANNATINTSDDRTKKYLTIEDAEKAAALEIKGDLRKFKFNDAIDKKGEDNARIHFGVSAQSVGEILSNHGLDPHSYSFYCYDEWDAELDDDGNEVVAAGSLYGIRYSELLSFIIAAL